MMQMIVARCGEGGRRLCNVSCNFIKNFKTPTMGKENTLNSTEPVKQAQMVNQVWRPLSVFLMELGKNYESTLRYFQYYVLIDCDHCWEESILRNGVIQPVSYVDTDPHTGIESRIKFDLVSPHGEEYFSSFFNEN